MHTVKKLFPQSLKNIYHLAQAILANMRFGFPSRKIKIIGITGTNGKTTTTQMVSKIFEKAGKKVAMASTINFRIDGKEEVNTTKFTTLSAFAVQKFIKKAVDARCEYLVLETSSHALDQCRVWGVCYATAVITNVTREHLDYHKTMAKYRTAKRKLFSMVAKNHGTLITNLDMEKPEEFLEFDVANKYGYTTKNESVKIKAQNDRGKIRIVQAEHIKTGADVSEFEIQGVPFALHMPGRFNIENALAATCVGLSQEIPLETIASALEDVMGVPGRMEKVENEKGIDIIVDYAVTPDSLEKLYEALGDLKQKPDAKIIAVFGSCGDRDRGKRPIMGKIVSQCVDVVIVTNEDPYWEDPQAIIEEVAGGVENKEYGKNFWKISDRRDAIRRALEMARPGDMVVITGKGAEETMAIKDKRIKWNDKKVVLEELERVK